MVIKEIVLNNFKLFKNFSIEFSKSINFIVGKNSTGKTSILEAINYLSTFVPLKSFDTDNDLVKIGESFFSILGKFYSESTNENFSIFVGFENRVGMRKKVKLNGNTERIEKLAGKIKTLAFLVEDFYIITGSPYYRRRIMDFVLISVSPEYYFWLLRYKKLIKQKNQLLKILSKTESQEKSLLEVYNKQLAVLSFNIFKERVELIKFLDFYLKEHMEKSLKVRVKYKSNLSRAFLEGNDPVNTIEKLFHESMYKEKLISKSLLGIHLDDLSIVIENIQKEARVILSQGQIRFLSIVFKLALAEFVYQKIGVRPILLIDDVLGELDEKNKEIIVEKILASNSQIIFALFSGEFLEKLFAEANVIKLSV